MKFQELSPEEKIVYLKVASFFLAGFGYVSFLTAIRYRNLYYKLANEVIKAAVKDAVAKG